MPCPENTFKKNPGCKQCTPCPNNTITGPIIEDIGYQSIFDCYSKLLFHWWKGSPAQNIILISKNKS